ncbi:MAG: sigma-70 family RNA polymerase sigma factor [Clostridiales bacterium]|jgi:RNA polymerase sigma-70 factor (ECF subfamily)|nr:sigma-70 family RNA polymerase sigma factor [Clostridiales bacterium]
MLKFEQVILKHQKLIYNLAQRIMGNPEDAQDVAQEVAIKIYRNLAKCKGEEFLAAWISKITHNACMDALRRRKGRLHESLDEMLEIGDGEAAKQVPDPDAGPELLLLQKELSAQIEAALNQLPLSHRLPVILRDIHGRTYDEMAEILDLPAGTVKSRLFRGRAKLKAILLEQNLN